MENQSYKFSVAPMMDWTDRHCRVFHRALTKQSLLYSEMVTADAVLHGDKERLIGFNPVEHPLALQLGGSEARKLAEAAKIGEDFGYDEINLNVGCPSDRVQSGRFGACLMAEPELVTECISAMISAVSIPVTVKCRIGIDDQDSEEGLNHFISTVKTSGCSLFIIHARKAWLQGLSPKENRDIPPLDYDRVYRLKAAFPELTIIINGGIETLKAAQQHLQHVDGVMLGRAAYHNPALLMEVDEKIFNAPVNMTTTKEAVESLFPYIEHQLTQGVKLHQITRHILGLFQGQRGARLWRRTLSEKAILQGAGIEVLQEALQAVSENSDSFSGTKAMSSFCNMF